MLDLAKQQPAAHETVARAADDLAASVYTSGTTGRSKGAMLTHGTCRPTRGRCTPAGGFKPGDVLLHALPIFHVHGLFVALHSRFLNGSQDSLAAEVRSRRGDEAAAAVPR